MSYRYELFLLIKKKGMSYSCITFQFPGIYAIYLVVHTWDNYIKLRVWWIYTPFKLKNPMDKEGPGGTSEALKSFGDGVNMPSLEVLWRNGFLEGSEIQIMQNAVNFPSCFTKCYSLSLSNSIWDNIDYSNGKCFSLWTFGSLSWLWWALSCT